MSSYPKVAAPVVQALKTLRGIHLIVAVTCVTELGDLSRFDNPRQLMGGLGITPHFILLSDKPLKFYLVGVCSALGYVKRHRLSENERGVRASSQFESHSGLTHRTLWQLQVKLRPTSY